MSTTSRVYDLIGHTVPFYVRFDSATIPEQISSTGVRLDSVRNLPDPVVSVDSIREYGAGTVYMTGTHLGGQKYGMYLNANFTGVTELTKTELSKVQARFEEIYLATLDRNLGHSWYSGTDHTFFLVDEKDDVIPLPPSLYSSSKSTDSYPFVRGLGVHLAVDSRVCLQEHHNLCASSFFVMIRDFVRSAHPKARISMKTVMDLPKGVIPAGHLYARPEVKNVYGLIPQNRDDSFQVAESHYHFGMVVSEQKAAVIIKTLDATVGLMCLSMFGKHEDSRRRLVSLPGDYAKKPGRLEYRALSNMWMCHPMTYYFVADVMRKAVALANNGYSGYWKATEHEVIDTLVSHDVERARKILERNRSVLTKMVQAAYPWVSRDAQGCNVVASQQSKRLDVLVNLAFNDVEDFIETPLDFEKNWMLNGARNSWQQNYGKMVYSHHADLMAKKKIQ